MRIVPLLIALLAAPLANVLAAEQVSGPIEATVLRIIDGDSFIAEAHVWPGHSVTVSVRIRGIDAPEMRSKCGAERRAALKARTTLTGLIGDAPVQISNIGGGKYYGRVLADVATRDGRQIGPLMLRASLARAYAGGKRAPYCG